MDREDKLRKEIRALLGENTPNEQGAPPITGSGNIIAGRDVIQAQAIKAPEPGAEKAILCPQCDEWTWRHTSICIYCLFDHSSFFHAKRLQVEKSVYQTRSRQAGTIALALFILSFLTFNKPVLFSIIVILMMISGYVFTSLYEKAASIKV